MRTVRLVVALLLGSSCLGIEVAAAQSALWNKAVDLASRADGYEPGKMISITEELNADGSLKSIIRSEFSFTYTSDGKVERMELIRAVQDGKDITSEMNKKRGNGKGGSNTSTSPFGFNGLLFSDDVQGRIKFLPGTTWEQRDGHRVASIPFEMDTKGMGDMHGLAEIDAESGIPVEARVTGKFPFVRDLRFEMRYEPLPSGGFVPSMMSFKGTLSLLFVKKPFRATMEFIDYHKVGE